MLQRSLGSQKIILDLKKKLGSQKSSQISKHGSLNLENTQQLFGSPRSQKILIRISKISKNTHQQDTYQPTFCNKADELKGTEWKPRPRCFKALWQRKTILMILCRKVGGDCEAGVRAIKLIFIVVCYF